MATIRTIAEDLNLSAATVSRALRDHDSVKSITRSKVHEAAQRLGYAKTKASRQQEETRHISVIVSGPGKSYSDMHELARRFVLVLNEEFARRGWHLHPVFISGDGEAGQRQMEQMLAGDADGPQMDGCLMVARLPGEFSQRYHQALADRFQSNIVMLCRHDVAHGLSGVTHMNYNGGVQAAEQVLGVGHRRIGWIGSLGSRDCASERLGGVLTTLREADASLVSELWINDRDLMPATAMANMIEGALPTDPVQWPTAWICSTDWLAAKLILWARGRGLRLPQDLSVVAFDNTQIAEELAETVITSVVFPYEQMARKAVELLESLINAPVADAIVWSLPSRLRVGQTLAVPVSST